MIFEARDIQHHAAATGFRPDSLEKVFRLIGVLEALRSHPFLKTRLVLKGGTALNLFVFEVPRLSVDIDLNYIGAVDRETMLKERPAVEEAIQAVCSREGLTVKRIPDEHAGGKWRLTYASSVAASNTLELDINFMLRVPLWPPAPADSHTLGPVRAEAIPILDLHELAAGKLAALCARNASRDVFDARELLRRDDLDATKLRLGFVVYGGCNRKDWRTVRIEDIDLEIGEVERELVTMLRADIAPNEGEVAGWTKTLVGECRELMSKVLPLSGPEREFIGRLNTKGDIAPELLTSDSELQDKIRKHPQLKWKALNVQKRAENGNTADPDEQ